MKTLFAALFFFSFVALNAFGQNASSAKLGIGGRYLYYADDQNILIPSLEGEYEKKLSNIVSVSGTFGLAYGRRTSMLSRDVYTYAFSTNLDGNLFLSPFGNQRKYNLKLGAGVSGMYFADWMEAKSNVESLGSHKRFLPGFSLILEQEVAVGERGLIGMKTYVQPYTKQTFAGGVLFKYGVRI